MIAHTTSGWRTASASLLIVTDFVCTFTVNLALCVAHRMLEVEATSRSVLESRVAPGKNEIRFAENLGVLRLKWVASLISLLLVKLKLHNLLLEGSVLLLDGFPNDLSDH